MRTKNKIIGAAAIVAALAAGGSAFTDSNVFAQATNGTNAGYGNVLVTGAEIQSVAYTLSTDGQTIDDVTLRFTGDMTNNTIAIGFGDSAQVTAGSVPLATCDTGGTGGVAAAYLGATPGSQTVGSTTVTCATGEPTAASERFDVAVSSPGI
jgi:hypothetical protein